MPSLKPNHRQVLAAKAIGGKRTQYRIDGVRGLVLDVRTSGQRTWFVRYQPGGRHRRKFKWFKIGDAAVIGLRDASDKADEIIRAVQKEGRDPHGERVAARRENRTFGDLFEEWHERYAMPKLKRADIDRMLYRRHLEPGFAATRIADLKRIEIGRFRDKVSRTKTPLTSNSVLVLINRVLNWSVDEGLIEVNPAARLRKVGERRPRERVLTPANIVQFWNALASMEGMTREHMARGEKGRMLSPTTRTILRLLLLTGQRRGEVAGALKTEFDLDEKEPVWTIPGARTKNGLLHRLPLCPMAAAEFRTAIDATAKECPFVFPSPDEPSRPISPEAVTRAMARMIAEIKITRVSPHDLRRTVGTGMARLGLPVHIRSLVLNHSPMSRGITDAVYNRYAYDREKREALSAWEKELAHLLAIAPTATKAASRGPRNAELLIAAGAPRSDGVSSRGALAYREGESWQEG
ncbi:MAG: tyrosine-type recombinase/integrase [Hyphomicrobium sp.]